MKTLRALADEKTGERSLRAKIRWATRADAAELRRIYSYYVENTTVSFEYEAPSVAEMERRIAEVEGVYPFLVCVVESERGKDGKNAEDFSAAANGEAEKASPVAADGEEKRVLTIALNSEREGKEEDSPTTKKRENSEARENSKTRKAAASRESADDESGVENGGERIVGYALAHRAFERAAYSWVAETAVYVDRDWRRRGIGEALYSALIEILEAQGIRTLYAVVVAENKASVEFHRRAGYRDFATFKNAGWKFGRWLDVVWLERTLGVWRDAEDEKTQTSRSADAGKTDASGRSESPENLKASNPAPTPVRPLAELEPEQFATFRAAESRRPSLEKLEI